MNKKANGTGNGHDQDEGKVVSFPTLAERDRARKQALKEEARESKAAQPPFLNLHNITPFARYMALAFIVVHLVVYLLLDPAQILKTFYTLGFVPGAFTGAFDFHWHTPLTLITHMFIHGSWMHLAFNLVMTLALGILFEREFGTRRTALFFFACGIAGALTFFAFSPFATTPVVGASGGISGLFGAALILLHQRKSFGMVAANMNKRDRGPWPIIGLWLALMVVIGVLGGGGIAWQAHLGGFIAGVALLRGLQKGIVKF